MNLNRILTELGWRPGRRATKFIAYFQLVEASHKAGCPVCRCLREQTLRSLDALLYEQVTDPATRGVLGESWGFCAWHAWMAREVQNSASGMAVIYEDLLNQVRERLDASRHQLIGGPLVRGWRRLFRRATPVGLVQARASRRRCALCADVRRAEESYLHTLVEYTEDQEFERTYARSSGICLPHLTLALAAFPGHRGAAPLLARTLAKLERLAKDLRSFIDKHDYRRRSPFTDDEASSWTRAIEFMAGRPELFGNDIARGLARTEATPAGPAAAEPRPDAPQSAETLRERLETLAFEKGRLELRLGELMQQLGDESSRAAALHYRPWSTNEDRKAVEMKLAGEPASARTWESAVQELQAEVEQLRARLAKYERPPGEARREAI